MLQKHREFQYEATVVVRTFPKVKSIMSSRGDRGGRGGKGGRGSSTTASCDGQLPAPLSPQQLAMAVELTRHAPAESTLHTGTSLFVPLCLYFFVWASRVLLVLHCGTVAL